MVSLIPDYDSLSAFAQQEIAGKFSGREHLFPDAMTPEYSQHYEQVKLEADTRKIGMDNREHFEELCAEQGLNSDQTERLAVRHQLNQQLGANEHFLGNGLTKDTAVHYPETPFGAIDQSIQYGPAVESCALSNQLQFPCFGSHKGPPAAVLADIAGTLLAAGIANKTGQPAAIRQFAAA